MPFPTPLGPVFTTLYLFFLAQTLLRLRLMDLHELLGKIVTQTVLASILAAVFTVLTMWVDKNNTSLFVFNTVVAAFVLLILLEPLRAKVEERVVALFFRERFELLRVLGGARARMAGVIEISELARLVLDALRFLNLWDERVLEAYASDEIALMLEVAERLATALENSKLYETIRERDRLAALGEMAAGLAHEIRNPLGAIKGAAQCLDPRRLPGEEGEFLEVIVEEVNRLNGVVSAFLDYARPLKQTFGPTDLNEVVTRTVRLIQNELPPGLGLKVELEEHLPRVEADAEQLKQVLINLVQNAMQALAGGEGQGGGITVKTVRLDRFNEFRTAEDSSFVEVHVSDTGPGIPPEQHQSIFVPFYTTKQKGTGLGLAISQRIVKNHGGTLSVRSKPDEGATFIIRLPAPPSEPSQPPEPGLSDGTSFPTARRSETPPPDGSPPPARPERKSKREKKRRAG